MTQQIGYYIQLLLQEKSRIRGLRAAKAEELAAAEALLLLSESEKPVPRRSRRLAGLQPEARPLSHS